MKKNDNQLMCLALGSLLLVAGCGGSSSDSSTPPAPGGSGGAEQTAGGATAAGGVSAAAGATAGTPMGGAPAVMGPVTSSVPGSKVLGTLSDAEAQSLCMDFAQSKTFQSLQDIGCRTAGLFAALIVANQGDAALQAACQSAYSECISSPGMCDSKPSAACLATVAELETCLNDQAASAATLAGQIPMCSTLKAATLAMSTGAVLGGGITQPASCEIAQQKCPELGDSMN